MNARSALFYTGSFSPQYIAPNTSYVEDATLVDNMNRYCSAAEFNPARCEYSAQLVGERMGTISGPGYSGLVQGMSVPPTNLNPNVSRSTVSAALYTVGKTTDVSHKACASTVL